MQQLKINTISCTLTSSFKSLQNLLLINIVSAKFKDIVRNLHSECNSSQPAQENKYNVPTYKISSGKKLKIKKKPLMYMYNPCQGNNLITCCLVKTSAQVIGYKQLLYYIFQQECFRHNLIFLSDEHISYLDRSHLRIKQSYIKEIIIQTVRK